MNFEFKLIERIESLEFKAATAKEIAVKLGMSEKGEIEEVQKTLIGMVAEGKLDRDGKDKYSKNVGRQRYKGVVRGNKRGFAFLSRDDGGEDLFIPAKALNGAMHGDTVMVKIVTGDEAQVTTVLERGIKRLVGEYKSSKDFGFVIPDGNSYYKDIYIAKKNSMSASGNMKVVVEIIGYGENQNPEGKIIEIIGKADEKQSEVLSILKSHDFYNVFPEAVEQEAKAKQYDAVMGRTSYVGLPTITIDGDDSKDLDDAISVCRINDKYKLYVHIADVSHYVEVGSTLDEEAFKRCTSVYFPGSVYPMLPKILSNGLCSLNEGEDRLALTCVMLIDKDGNVVDRELVKSVINNTRRMTYNVITKIIEGDKELTEQYSDIMPMINDMNALSRILKARRNERGTINFDTKECKIILDSDGNVDRIEPYPYTVSNEIIEEFMLIANETVAKFASDKELPFVYRAHEKPDPEKMIAFKEFVGSLGFVLGEVEDVTPKKLQELLVKIEGNPLEQVISKVMLRSMKKAKYTTECLGHFGLAADYYCHFTSPIRRYPDLQIHRVIKGYLDGQMGSVPKLAQWCKEVADTSSERERASELAEREIDDFYKTEYMSKHVGEQFEGIVSGVTGFGVFIELDNTCEGLARMDNLPRDTYNFIEERFRMLGANHSYMLGQKVKIEVLECDSIMRRVSFKVLEEDGTDTSVGGSGGGNKPNSSNTVGGGNGGKTNNSKANSGGSKPNKPGWKTNGGGYNKGNGGYKGNSPKPSGAKVKPIITKTNNK